MPLTELAIKNAKSQEKPYTLTDGGGLGIEISPSGGKLWRWRYRYNGTAQVLALGKYPAVSLSQARKQRDEARELVNAGQHPSEFSKAVVWLQTIMIARSPPARARQRQTLLPNWLVLG